ncbi:MAG TPA: molybdopterin-dependent oxidoreductase [Gammaproteobacteria bacterium]
MMINRRDLLKLGAVATGALFTQGNVLAAPPVSELSSGKDFSPKTGLQRISKPSACWQCVTRCPNIGYIEDGRLVKVEGQPRSIRTMGLICAKGQAGVNQVNDPDRILYPMKRVGKRGEGKWKKISWDDALTEVADRLKTLRDEGHPEKFMFHYGRMKASSSKIVKQFLAAYGTKTIGNHTSICEGGKWTAQELTWGKHYDNWDIDRSRFILNFGSNVIEAHTNHVPLAQRVVNAMVNRDVQLVTFDVRLANTVAKSTNWIPIKPGTDGAVALAMCHYIMNEDLYGEAGRDFLKFCKVTKNPDATIDEKIYALKQHLAQYTPEWAEQVSGVPAHKIRSVAREFATHKPAALISYRGAVAHANGNDTERAIQMLAAITGDIDRPGARCRGVGAKWKYPHGAEHVPKAKKLDILDGFKGEVAYPTHHISQQVLDVIRDGSQGRPDVYMWYCYQPVYSNPQVQQNIEVLKDEEVLPYTVCVSPFYDESAALADLILPDTTYLERWDWEDMVGPNQVPEFYIRQPLVKPMGEVRDFKDVCCELAERMGFPLGYSSAEEFVQLSCEMTPGIKEAGGFRYMVENGVWVDPESKPNYYSYKKEIAPEKLTGEGVIYDEETGVYWNWHESKAKSEVEARTKGYTHTKNAYKGYIGQSINGTVYAGFEPDKLNKSGYFEFYSSLLEEKGYPPLPTYTPIPEHEKMSPGQLILSTYKVNVQSHSRTQNCKWLTEIYHENPAWLNPEDAVALGIRDKDKIRVKSELGEIETFAHVTPAVVPGVIAVSNHCGHWEYGRVASGKTTPDSKDDTALEYKWWDFNGVHPNWIIPDRQDPINGQQAWMDTVVTVSRV